MFDAGAPHQDQVPPFASTGPDGHRGRMRARLLLRGPEGLADYEILEMLFFLGIPRRDTRPLAKATINRFGSLHAVLGAPAALLRLAGVDGLSAGVIEVVGESARRLARAERRSRPLLSDIGRLFEHLDLPARLARPPHLAALLLNNRNQLLDELHCADTQAPASVAQAVARRALQTHATALILATCRPGMAPEVTEQDASVTGCVLRSARVLSVVLHDHWVLGEGEAVSLRRKGLL